MLIRGTTPTLEFVIPFDTDLIAEVFVTIAQNGKVVINKNRQECKCAGNKISVGLTQEETLKLRSDCIAEIQIRARTLDGEAIASNIIREQTYRILKDGVI